MIRHTLTTLAVAGALVAGGATGALAQTKANPCGAKNPCAAKKNPCAAKKP